MNVKAKYALWRHSEEKLTWPVQMADKAGHIRRLSAQVTGEYYILLEG